jgi:hypothetical protein
MPRYDFRIRFHLPGEDYINADSEELLVLEDETGSTIRLKAGSRGSTIKDHSHAALIGGPYQSTEEASEAAEWAKRALLIWAVRNRMGIDLGGRPPQGVITEEGMKWAEKQFGGPVRADVHGIDVYEHIDGLVFVAVDSKAHLGKGAEAFIKQVAASINDRLPLSQKQELAGEILSASYFDETDRSRFITLITALEALLDPELRPVVAQETVDTMIQILHESGVGASTRDSMLGTLQRLKRESIGQAGRALADRLLAGNLYDGRSPGQFFAFCYDLRSKILHSGKVPDTVADFSRVSAKAKEFLTELLIASYEEGGRC